MLTQEQLYRIKEAAVLKGYKVKSHQFFQNHYIDIDVVVNHEIITIQVSTSTNNTMFQTNGYIFLSNEMIHRLKQVHDIIEVVRNGE